MRRKWTEDEDLILRKHYASMLSISLAKMLNRSCRAVYNRATLFGLRKSRQLVADISRDRIVNNPDHPARLTRFQKGHTPKNKGKKQSDYMTADAIERTSKTRFKKGHLPGNHKPVGYEAMRSDGYVWIKVAEPNHFELKQRVVWRQHHGDIPEGCNIQFRDKNRMNFDINNLYLISRNAQMVENSIMRYPPDLRTAMIAIGTLHKIINNQNKKNNEQQNKPGRTEYASV